MGKFTAKASSAEGSFELPPAGAHPAVLVGLFDLGTHERTFQGVTKRNRKLYFVWELTAEADSKGQSFVVGQDYTWSLHKKAGLRPIIESWVGKTLRDDEAFEFDALLGQPCLVTLTGSATAAGKKFVEVSGVCPPMRGLVVPPASRPITTLLLDDLDAKEDDKIAVPEWVPRLYGREIPEEIKQSFEWQALPDTVPF